MFGTLQLTFIIGRTCERVLATSGIGVALLIGIAKCYARSTEFVNASVLAIGTR